MRSVLAFRNRQHTRSLNVPLLRRITRYLLKEELGLAARELGFHFIDAIEMARLNQRFLQHEGSTDVITFNHGDELARTLHGEIFISIPDAVKQARAFGTTWQSEAVRYVIHGLLHLSGFDDLQPGKRREMKREENRLLLKMSRRFPLKQIALKRRSQLSTLNPQPR